MVDSEENDKFDLGVKGLKASVFCLQLLDFISTPSCFICGDQATL